MTQQPPAPGSPGGPDGERYADDAHRYLLESRIATGGMGEVWRATDTVLHRPVAVKLLKHEYADDPMFRSRFETEARHAAALVHPGVASVFDFGQASPADGSPHPRPFLVMELVDGQPLSVLLRDGRPLDPAAVRDLLAQAGEAIGAAHAAGIVHRDVKPANLLITPERQVKITDFGIARAAEGLGLTETGQVMGTPQYLSPEQARGEQTTPASDVYALGVVAFECLAGQRPFQKESPVATALAHLHDPVPDLPGSVPADLAAVVRRALAKAPADRFPDAAAFALALRDPATAALAVPPATTAGDDSTQLLTGVGAGAGAAAAAAAAYDPGPPTSTLAAAPTGTRPAETGPQDADRRRWWAIPAVLLALALAVGGLALAFAGEDDDEPTDRPTPTVKDDTVRIDEDTFVGRPVDEVAEELRDLDLKVSTEAVANPGDETPGLVTAVNPTGKLDKGDRVTVSYWGEVVESEEPEPTPTETSQSPEPSEEPSPTESAEPTPTETSAPPSPTQPTTSAASAPASSAASTAPASRGSSPSPSEAAASPVADTD